MDQEIVQTLKQVIGQAVKKADRIVVMATGGFDSSLLVSLSRPWKPVLYFAACLHPSLRDYNAQAIHRCRKLSRMFRLKFFVIPITQAAYGEARISLGRIMERFKDSHLPAIKIIFAFIQNKQKGPVLLLHGMDMNTLCAKPAGSKLHAWLQKEAFPSLKIHQRLAAQEKITFCAPYLDHRFIRIVEKIPLKQRRHRSFMRCIARQKHLLSNDFIDARPRHTVIPLSFRLCPESRCEK